MSNGPALKAGPKLQESNARANREANRRTSTSLVHPLASVFHATVHGAVVYSSVISTLALVLGFACLLVSRAVVPHV